MIDYTLFTTEGWKHYIHYAHRFAYDGAPKVEDSENQEQLAKRFNAIEDKISKLYGDKPLVARRTGDPVAKAMKVYIVKVLAAKGTKVKDIPKLGATVEEVEESAKALKLGKAKVA
ncbi:MAG: hypothetical protein GTN93_04105, partial [Anaerolineae bacterium]|nr:hypothetical protein [Anaerolineae bacterium]